MDLESVRAFADEKKELESRILAHNPGENIRSTLHPLERYDLLWREIDALAADELVRNEVRITGLMADGLSVIFKRYISESHRDGKTISATWNDYDREVITETISEGRISESKNPYEDPYVQKMLGLLEESVSEAKGIQVAEAERLFMLEKPR